MNRRRWVFLPLAALAALLIVGLILFDWNWFKGPLENQVSAALGREFEIAGELDVDLSMTPTITLEQVRIANPAWGSRPNMATIERVEFALDLWRLLDGQTELPFLHVQEPDLLLETNGQGATNWQFGDPDQPSEGPPPIPIIRDLEVTNAALRYRAPERAADLSASLETVTGAIREGDPGIEVSAEGTLGPQPLSANVTGGPVAQLKAATEPYPFALDARLGGTRLTIAGSAEQPLQAGGLSAEIDLQSPESHDLLALAGLDERDLGAVGLDLTLTRDGQVWSFDQIDAKLGESDLSGSVSVDRAGEEPAIAADLHSNQVRLADVRRLIDALTERSAETPEDPTVEAAFADARTALSGETADKNADPASSPGLSRGVLPAIDAELSYTVDRLSGPEITLRDLNLRGRLKDRLPQLAVTGGGQYQNEPLQLGVQLGPAGPTSYPIDATLTAAGTQAEVHGALTEPEELAGLRVQFDVASQNLKRLLALVEVEVPEIPAFELHGQLDQDGPSWQLSNLDGRLGQSDIQGRVTVRLDRPEPLITADLASDRVQLEDLRALLESDGKESVDGDPQAALDAAIAKTQTTLEDREQLKNRGQSAATGPGFGLHRDLLPGVDAEVSYAVKNLSGPELSLTNIDAYGRLKDRLPRLELTGGGQYNDAPVELDVRVGSADGAVPSDGAYPIQAWVKAAATELEIAGEIGKPATLDGLDLEVRMLSRNIDEIAMLAGIDLPEIPSFLISGHVIQDGQVWQVADFYGQFSDSDLIGTIAVDLADQRPFITVDLRSNRLLIGDLMTVTEKATAIEERMDESAPDESGDQAVISPRGINFDALPEVDADLSFAGDFVDLPELTFDQLNLDLKLRDQIALLDASGDGKFRNGPISFEARAGTEQSLENPDARYPIDVRLETKRTEVTVNGTLTKPGQAAGLQLDVALHGPNLDRLGAILQLSLPTTPPFELQSHLTQDDNRWNLTALNGTIGDSDIQGEASVVLGGERPTLKAKLTSKKLDLDDLGLLVGAPADPDETVSARQERAAAVEAASQGVLPNEPFDVPELRAMDARVSYQANAIQAAKLPLEAVTIDLTLEDGQLRIEPLRFDLAEGQLQSAIRLDGRSDTLSGDLELDFRRIRLNRLLAGVDIDVADIEMEREGIGTFGGHAQLEVRGNSVQEIAASADGKLAVIMDGGRINALIVEAIGLDVGESLGLLFSGDEVEQSEMVPIQCFVGRFDVQDGVMQTEALVLETSDSTITGKGQIDLGEETLSLELLAHPKDASALSASTPVRIEGTFGHPKIDLVSEELKEKSLAALALGVVLPVVGAVLPFLEEGETKGTNCRRLIESAAAEAPASTAPKPR